MLEYQVHKYTFDNLVDLMIEGNAEARAQAIRDKDNLKYFENYFEELNARTIVVEDPYIDRGYMEDYAGYYSRCFGRYRRRCKRLHFFDDKVSTSLVESLLQDLLEHPPVDGEAQKSLQDAYLGFLVVKPLPYTIIGRTCLSTYPSDGGARCYPTSRRYTANLFGIELTVASLAFQEQDRTISACATSALWSLLQASSVLFQHKELSPVEITTAAATRFPTETRAMPTGGLDAVQMADVIRSAGLEPVHVDVQDGDYLLKSTLYAYLSAGIPVVLCLDLMTSDGIKKRNLHAVAVTGFRIGQEVVPCNCGDGCGFLLKASQIKEIYAHNDQVGPFARMCFDSLGAEKNPDDLYAATTLITPVGKEETKASQPLYMILPLYHKIRIPFREVFLTTHEFDLNFRLYWPDELKRDLVWEIILTELNVFKKELLLGREGIAVNRQQVLLRRLPRYMWRSVASFNGKRCLELLFDATDIEQGRLFVAPVEYDEELTKGLTNISEMLFQKLGPTFAEERAGAIFDYYRPKSPTSP